MNNSFKNFLITIAAIFIAGGAFAYGALTAPKQSTNTHSPSPAPSQSVTPKPEKFDPEKALVTETPTIRKVLQTAYPDITTLYIINKGRLFEEGRWFGTTLTYKGSDSANRDTLRVLLEKKDGAWKLRTTPPVPLLAAKKYPDVPKSVLKEINKPISLPGTDTSPTVTATE